MKKLQLFDRGKKSLRKVEKSKRFWKDGIFKLPEK